MGKYIVRRLLQMIPVIIGVDIPDLRLGVRPAGDPASGAAVSDRARPATSPRSGRSTTWTSRWSSSTSSTWAMCFMGTWARSSTATLWPTNSPPASRRRSGWP